MTATPTVSPYKVKAESVEACSCHHGCNCQFGGFPNEGICEFIIGYAVEHGHVGDVPLDGVRAVVVAKYPKAIHEGHGHIVLFVDDKASQKQADAFATILSGKLGGMPWEALAGTVERFEGPVRRPVDIHVARERSHVRIPGAVEMRFTPLRDPVTAKEKKVSIVYPDGGFFWNEGHMATTETMHVEHGDLTMNWPHRYASTAEVNWTNHK
jgi:hypothetical protein